MAVVTEEPRLVLEWRGKKIVDISRAFLDTNGAHQETAVEVEMPSEKDNFFEKQEPVTDVRAKWLDTLKDLNVCSQKGLVEMFDGSIGAASVFMPYGGKYQTHRDPGHGGQAAGAEGQVRHRHHDELRL